MSALVRLRVTAHLIVERPAAIQLAVERLRRHGLRGTILHLYECVAHGDVAAEKRRHADHALVADRGDFHHAPVGHHIGDGTHPAARKIHKVDLFTRLVTHLPELEGNGAECRKEATVIGLRKRRQ